MGVRGIAALQVIDASNGVPGQFAGRLFADHGAEVLLAEPVEGTATRHAAPLAKLTGESLLFRHLNAGKGSVTADLTSDVGLDRFRALCSGADVVIVDDRCLAAQLGDGAAGPVVAMVDDFGAIGPYTDWKGSELIHQALSGSMYVTGLADREPLYGVGLRAHYAAGTNLYIGTVAALYARVAGRPGPSLVEVTVHEAAAMMEQNFSTQWAYNGTVARRDEKTRTRGRARCADGWVVYFIRTGQWPQFCDAFGASELRDDPRFAMWSDLTSNWALAESELQRFAADVTVAEAVAAADEHRLVLAPFCDPLALREEPHLVGRGFWTAAGSAAAPATALGPIFRFSRIPARRHLLAPKAGYADRRPRPRPAIPRGAGPVPTTARRPLEGVRILELTSAWAGPMAARILASLGAEVIKIEGPDRLDGWRGERVATSGLINYPSLDPGDRPYDRHLFFNTQNHDKRSLVLDIKAPGARDVLAKLVTHVNVILANWSPGALARAGLSYEAVTGLNPEAIVVEMPAMGNDGPLAGQRGLGPTMEAMAGIASLIGYPEGRPLGSGSAYLDPIGALMGAAATLTALLHRALTGEGQYVEVAQREAAMHWIGELLLDGIDNENPQVARGNDVDGAAPHGAYPTRGEDAWIAIAVETDAQWGSLCAVLSAPELVDDERFSAPDRRLRHRRAVDEALSARTSTYDKHALAAELQAVGVPAAPVHDGRDLFEDAHLRARGWFTNLEHPVAGSFDYPGLSLRFDGDRLPPRRASPCFGADNESVLRDLGYDNHRIAELATAGIIADRPTGT